MISRSISLAILSSVIFAYPCVVDILECPIIPPLPSRDAMWFEIHELGVAIGKDDNLSYHQARHSFGTMLISESIPIESIAGMMGHSNISTTQAWVSQGYA